MLTSHEALPNCTPPTFHGTLLEETALENTGGISTMEKNLRSEEEKLIQNQKDLEKLKALSENLERQMAGLTMSSTMSTTPEKKIEIREVSSDFDDTITENKIPLGDSTADVIVREMPTSEIDRTGPTDQNQTDPSFHLEPLTLDQSDVSAPTESTPRSNHVSIVKRKGSVRKISHRAKAEETSYLSLPQGFALNSSLSSSLSSISKASDSTHATLLGISKSRKSPDSNRQIPTLSNQNSFSSRNRENSTLISMTKEKTVSSPTTSQTSVDRIIKETWGEILEKENANGFQLGVGLSLPDLSVTPISTVNESTNQMPSSILRGVPSESGSSEVKSSKSVSFKDDLESLSESDTETLTRLLLERLTSADSFRKISLDETGQSSQQSKVRPFFKISNNH